MPEPEPQPELEPELKLSQGHIAATKRMALASQSDSSDQKATCYYNYSSANAA